MTKALAFVFIALVGVGCSKKDPVARVKELGDKVCAAPDYATGRPAWQAVLKYISDNQEDPALQEMSKQLAVVIIDHSDAAATGDLKRIVNCALKTGAF
jgi:hypothetical protein